MPSLLQPVARDTLSWIGRTDPRARLLSAVAFSVVIAMADRLVVLGAALAVMLCATTLSGLSFRVVGGRLLLLGGLLLPMILLLPLTTPGTPLLTIGPIEPTREGVLLGATVALKTNAIMLALLALLGSMGPTTLGHTLSHLHMPDKLTHLLLFTIRYIDVLHGEMLRLRSAMKIRGFRPRVDGHTYRTYGYLIGMLLVRSFDRSQRVVGAMKCRGFRGRFYLLDHFAFSRRDLPFCIASIAILLTLALLQWL